MTQPVRPRTRRRRRLVVPAVIVAVLSAVLLRPDPAGAAVDEAKVDVAIARAIEWLYKQQKPAGHWELQPRREGTEHAWQTMQGETFGGFTALCTFALLEAGERATDERLNRAIEFLRTADMFGTYAIGVRCMVFANLPPSPENRKVLQDDVSRLIAGRIGSGPAEGLWDYDSNKPGGRAGKPGAIDLSCSQFAVLGLWSAQQAGVHVPPEVWMKLDKIWRSHQRPDGAWSYDGKDDGVRVTITGAGVATLLIVQDILGGVASASAPGGVDPNIARGIVHLDKNFGEADTLGAYAWYAYERIGTAGGYRYIGRHEWYDRGANKLLASQAKDGSWPAGGAAGMQPLQETAMSLLFLAHGRTPVLLSKLNYVGPEAPGKDFSWNRRPRDVANLVKFVANSTEVDYAWQIVSLAAPPEDLLSVPVMLLSGAKMAVFTEREREKIRTYLEGGGMIVAVSEAPTVDGVAVGNDDFSRSIIDLGRKVANRAFRPLPPTHPIFTDQQFRPRNWKERPPAVWGLTNGVRELIVLIPEGDVGRAWQTGNYKADPVKYELGTNVLQYAVAKAAVGGKGKSHVIRPNYIPVVGAATQPSAGGTGDPAAAPAAAADPAATGPATNPGISLPKGVRRMAVGRLKVGANWDPEPGAWRRLAALLTNNHRLYPEAVPVDADPAQLKDVPLVHWTGTGAVKLTDAQRAALARYVADGGTLVVDAAGGDRAFADAAQAELAAAFKTPPDAVGTVLAADDPLYRMREAKVDAFEYRRYLQTRATGRLNAPLLRGIEQVGRTGVFFSREDLTGGCVGQNTDGIIGYAPQTATAIMRNIVLTAAKGK